MLRNPTHRAISHYHMEVNNKNESRPIKKALDEEDKTINKEYKNLRNSPNYHSPSFQTFSYKNRGLYAEQIQRFQHYFKPEQLHILKSESFFKNPKKETQNIYKFLEINTTFSPTIQTINKTQKKQIIEPSIIKELNTYFEPHNNKLYSLLNKKLWN